jgi:hypothetical protein
VMYETSNGPGGRRAVDRRAVQITESVDNEPVTAVHARLIELLSAGLPLSRPGVEGEALPEPPSGGYGGAALTET